MSLDLATSIWTLGEALWDSTPAGLFLGGAPLNVAMHLRQLSVDVALVSAIGDDRLGHELHRRLTNAGVNVSMLGMHKTLETGFVCAHIQPNGNALYSILQDVAWDKPPIVPMPSPPEPLAIIYSSLAMRTEFAHSRIDAWLSAAGDAIRIFDVNLRPPHYCLDHIMMRLEEADWIKANYEEASLIMDAHNKEPKVLAEAIQKRFKAAVILLTCDAQGAGVWMDGQWLWQSAPRVDVVDTIGAGDAFLASFVAQYILACKPAAYALEFACAHAAQVVRFSGAVPDLKISH